MFSCQLREEGREEGGGGREEGREERDARGQREGWSVERSRRCALQPNESVLMQLEL